MTFREGEPSRAKRSQLCCRIDGSLNIDTRRYRAAFARGLFDTRATLGSE